MKYNLIIPCFNKQNFILRCLESCFNQTYKDYKVIFIDNESTDSSLEIVKQFKINNNLDFVIDIAKNIYPRCWDECLYKAFEYLDGEYFTIIGADDYIDKDYIYNFNEWLKFKNEKILIAQSSLYWMKNEEKVNEVTHQYFGIEDLKLKLSKGCYINSPTVFYNKSILDDNLFKTYPELYSGAADYDLYCQLVDRNIYIENIGQWIGYYYNINDQQATWQMHTDTLNYSNIIRKKWKTKWKI